ALGQTPTLPLQEQGLQVSKRWCPPIGAQSTGEVAPNRARVGTPTPAAKCNGPVSPETNTSARLSTARYNARSGIGCNTGASGTSRLKWFSNDSSRAPVPVAKINLSPAAAASR